MTDAHSSSAAQAPLRIEHLVKAYGRGKPVLKDISLTVTGNSMTAIIGPSGTGKSTLLRCINRLIEPTRGKIFVAGEDVCPLSGVALRRVRRRIGMIFQEFNLVERLSVMENILCGRLGYMPSWKAWLRKYDPEDIDYAYALLETVGLAEFASTRADSLSGGQRQRVGIARAVMQRPSILLADEPTSSLDPKTSVEIMELLLQIMEENQIPVLINIHDVVLGKRFAKRIVGLSGGYAVFDGPPDTLSNEILQEIYGGEGWLV